MPDSCSDLQYPISCAQLQSHWSSAALSLRAAPLYSLAAPVTPGAVLGTLGSMGTSLSFRAFGRATEHAIHRAKLVNPGAAGLPGPANGKDSALPATNATSLSPGLGGEGCLNSRSTQSKSMGTRTSAVPPVPAVRFVSGQNAPAGKRTSRPTRRLHDASWTACWYCSWLWGAGAACGAAFLAMKQVAGKPAWAKLRSRKRSQQDWPVPGLSFPASTTPQHGLSLARCGQYEFAEV